MDYIELVNPAASLQAVRDCEAIARLGLRSKILTHTRCNMSDVKTAVGTGVQVCCARFVLRMCVCGCLTVRRSRPMSNAQGVNLYMATSSILSKHSHGKGIDAVIDIASEVIKYVKSHGLEVRFSCEDTFRSDRTDLLRSTRYPFSPCPAAPRTPPSTLSLLAPQHLAPHPLNALQKQAVDKLGVDRVGLADTVGIATPFEVYDTVHAVREVLSPTTGIEFHTHDDTGCCIANAYVALEAGATHIDTCVLGIGEVRFLRIFSRFFCEQRSRLRMNPQYHRAQMYRL